MSAERNMRMYSPQEISAEIHHMEQTQPRYKFLNFLTNLHYSYYQFVAHSLNLPLIDHQLVNDVRRSISYNEIAVFPEVIERSYLLEMMKINTRIYSFLEDKLKLDPSFVKLAEHDPSYIYKDMSLTSRKKWDVISKALKFSQNIENHLPPGVRLTKKFRKLSILYRPQQMQSLGKGIEFTMAQVTAMCKHNGKAFKHVYYPNKEKYNLNYQEEIDLLNISLETQPDLFRTYFEICKDSYQATKTAVERLPELYWDVVHRLRKDSYLAKVCLVDLFRVRTLRAICTMLKPEAASDLIIFALVNGLRAPSGLNGLVPDIGLREKLLSNEQLTETLFAHGVEFDMNSFMHEEAK